MYFKTSTDYNENSPNTKNIKIMLFAAMASN